MAVPQIPRDQLVRFVNENFESPGSELIECDAKDWKERPENLLRIQDPRLKEWALTLNGYWKVLCRRIDPKVKTNPDRHSILWVDEHFIVPGGEYREIYYWGMDIKYLVLSLNPLILDTYWIIRGLLASGMYDTPKAMARNMASLIEQ
jgi:alpha,alpha-trehalase